MKDKVCREGFGRSGCGLGTMLTTLRIKNLALVSELTWELGPGLNVITGETGAGKSVLLGGLQLVLGQRADRTVIRSGADQCVVEAVFSLGEKGAAVQEWLREQGFDEGEDGSLLVRRSITSSGTNRQFINGSPTTLGLLAGLGDLLVDLHGPHEHQSLLQPLRQLAILDAFGGLGSDLDKLREVLQAHRELENQRSALVMDDATHARRMDLLRFQVREIGDARLDPSEETTLDNEYQRVRHASRLIELSMGCLQTLGEEEGAVLSQMGALGRLLGEMTRIDSAIEPWVRSQELVVEQLQDLQQSVSRYAEGIDLDAARLTELEERLHLLQSLKRKYGGSIEAVLEFGQKAERELSDLEMREVQLERLDQAMARLRVELERLANILTGKRKKLLERLSKSVQAELRELGFRQSRFAAEIVPLGEIGSHGNETVEFQFSPNPGEPLKPLRSIASSGELARVMLALKTVLAANDDVPVLVFDEVDANVGGETAHVVGDKMRQLGAGHQVICITHLPQVAACGDTHYLVKKEEEGGRTLSRLTRLGDEARVEELGRMLGGGAAARRHAEALLSGAPSAE